MKKFIFGIILVILMIITFSLPAIATPTTSIEILDLNIELISGGVVGQETKIRISIDMTAEAITDITQHKDMAVCQGQLKFYLIDSTWYLINSNKIEKIVTDYEYPSYNGPGAHAEMSWNASIDYTWIPYMAGPHYISAQAIGYTSITDGNWPPVWINEYKKEYTFEVIEIEEAPLGGWQNGENFEISIGSGFLCYETYEFDGLFLGEEINQKCPIAGHAVGIHMTSGTMILGTGKILINFDGSNVSIDIPSDALFSQPVTITVDGVSVLTFSEIVGGIPQ